MKLAVVGDSVSYGINSDYEPEYQTIYGWFQILTGQADPATMSGNGGTLFSQWPDAAIVNFSIPASFSSDWNDSAYYGMMQLALWKPDLTILFVGGNDMLDSFSETGQGISLAAVRANIAGIIEKLRAINRDMTILLVGYYDLFDGLSGDLPSSVEISGITYNFQPLSGVVVQFNAELEDLALDYDCAFLSISSAFMNHCYGGIYCGGEAQHLDPLYVSSTVIDIHPSTRGHEIIAALILEKLSTIN